MHSTRTRGFVTAAVALSAALATALGPGDLRAQIASITTRAVAAPAAPPAALAPVRAVPASAAPFVVPEDPAAVGRELGAAISELEHLQNEAQRIASETAGLEPQRAALLDRARRQARLLYHLTQGEALAIRGGPEALLSHLALKQHARRALGTTLNELSAARERAARVTTERATNEQRVAETQARRAALEGARRRNEALGGMNLGVTGAASAFNTDPLAPAQTVYGGGVSATAPVESSFEDAAGRLLFPVAGRAEVRRAQRAGADGPGIEVLAPAGSPVRAVYAGRVAFADRYGPYGRIVILDHGDHYYTVSANLGSFSVRVGDEVTPGTVVGTVGDDGRGPMLYFEVRRGGDTVDPGPWLGL